MGGREFEISAWDPSTMAPDVTCLLVGKRNSGKSVLMRDLFWHMRKRLDLVVGMSPSEVANKNLEFFVPKAYIFHNFNDDKLAHVLEWQRRAVANGKAMKVGLVLDDCMSEQSTAGGKKKKVMGSQDINRVFKLGRHLKLMFINAMQYIKDAPPDIRGNVDLLFCFNTSSNSEREKLWKEYFAMFKTFSDFNKVFDACAVGYDCIVLDTRAMAKDPNKCVFYYRATYHTQPFRVGRPVFWRMSEYFWEDRADYDMDPLKVLGAAEARNLLADEAAEEDDDQLAPKRAKGGTELTVVRR